MGVGGKHPSGSGLGLGRGAVPRDGGVTPGEVVVSDEQSKCPIHPAQCG